MARGAWALGLVLSAAGCTRTSAWTLPDLDPAAELLLLVALPNEGGAPVITPGTPTEPPPVRVVEGDRLELWAYACGPDALGITPGGAQEPGPLPFTAQAFVRNDDAWSALDPTVELRSARVVPQAPCQDLVLEALFSRPLAEGAGVYDATWLEASGDRIAALELGPPDVLWVGGPEGLAPVAQSDELRGLDWDGSSGAARGLAYNHGAWTLLRFDANGMIEARAPGPVFTRKTSNAHLSFAPDGPQAWVVTGVGGWSFYDGTAWQPEALTATTARHGLSVHAIGDRQALITGWCDAPDYDACAPVLSEMRDGRIEASTRVPLKDGRVTGATRSPDGTVYAVSSVGEALRRAPGDSRWASLMPFSGQDANEIAATADGVLVGWSDLALQALHDGQESRCSPYYNSTDVRKLLIRGERVVAVLEQTNEHRSSVMEVIWGRLRPRCDLAR